MLATETDTWDDDNDDDDDHDSHWHSLILFMITDTYGVIIIPIDRWGNWGQKDEVTYGCSYSCKMTEHDVRIWNIPYMPTQETRLVHVKQHERKRWQDYTVQSTVKL